MWHHVAHGSTSACRNGCIFSKFGVHPTCCTRCTGPDGPHSRDCPHKNKQIRRACEKGCGRPAFKNYRTCCTKCTGHPSSHAHDCAEKCKGEVLHENSGPSAPPREPKRKVLKVTAEKLAEARAITHGDDSAAWKILYLQDLFKDVSMERIKATLDKCGGDKDLAGDMLLRQPPDLRRDPEGWFRHYDVRGKKELYKEDVVAAVSYSFRGMTQEAATSMVLWLWPSIDHDLSGSISFDEFIAPGGLRDLVLGEMRKRTGEKMEDDDDDDCDDVSTPGEERHLIAKALETLGDKGALGIYFSASLAKPFAQSTRMLDERWSNYKAKGLDLKLMLVSADSTEAAYKKLAGGREAWQPVPFEQKAVRRRLAEVLHVETLPALIILDKEGEVITADGLKAVEADPDGEKFPWHPPDDDEKEKEEEDSPPMATKTKKLWRLVDDAALAEKAERMPLTQEGFDEVVNSKSIIALRQFLRRIITTKGWEVADEAAFSDFVWDQGARAEGVEDGLRKVLEQLSEAKWVTAPGEEADPSEALEVRTASSELGIGRRPSSSLSTGTGPATGTGGPESSGPAAGAVDPPPPSGEGAGGGGGGGEGGGEGSAAGAPSSKGGSSKGSKGKGKGKSKEEGSPPSSPSRLRLGPGGEGDDAGKAEEAEEAAGGGEAAKGPGKGAKGKGPKGPAGPAGKGGGPPPLAKGKGKGKPIDPTREDKAEWVKKKTPKLRWKRFVRGEEGLDNSLFAKAEWEEGPINIDDLLEWAEDTTTERAEPVEKKVVKPILWESTDKLDPGKRRMKVALLMRKWKNFSSTFLQLLETKDLVGIMDQLSCKDADVDRDQFAQMVEFLDTITENDWENLASEGAEEKYVWDSYVEGFYRDLNRVPKQKILVKALEAVMEGEKELQALAELLTTIEDGLMAAKENEELHTLCRTILTIGNHLNAGEKMLGCADGFDVVLLLEDQINIHMPKAHGISLISYIRDQEMSEEARESMTELTCNLEFFKKPLEGESEPAEIGDLQNRIGTASRSLTKNRQSLSVNFGEDMSGKLAGFKEVLTAQQKMISQIMSRLDDLPWALTEVQNLLQQSKKDNDAGRILRALYTFASRLQLDM